MINIFFKDYGEKGLDFIEPQFELRKPDGSGVWKYDFFVKTKYGKYIIETDGLYSHAQGAVTTDYFDNLQEKSNYPQQIGIRVLHLTNKKVREKPEECIWELRRHFMGDKDLYDLYLNRVGEIKPHDVQRIALQKLDESRKKGKDKALVVLATGLGKTYLSAFDVRQFDAKKVLFVVHINEILKQSENSFGDVLPKRIRKMGFYNGIQKDKNKDILFASIQTINKKQHLEAFKPSEFDYIIIDETHHSAAPSYKKILKYFKPKFLLGLTATPDRMDRKEILPFYNNNVAFEMNQKEAIEKGYLVPFHYYGFNDDIDYSGIYFNGFKYDVQDLNKLLMIEKRDKAIIEKFKEYGFETAEKKFKKTIAFCVSTEHANWCAEHFKKAGINAIAIHSKLDGSDMDVDEKDRDKLIGKFRKGEYDVACVVNMFNEGIDIPDVECLLFLRPTESKSIFIQHMGRGLRISPKKREVTILDFIGNYKTAGLVLGGLGLENGLKDLKKEKKGEKIVYYYDNNGCKVIFETEVVDVFKKLIANTSEHSDLSLIPENWKEYGDYLEENTQEGVKLHWKIGNKNNHIEVHLWALDFIADKLGKLSSEQITDLLRKESARLFPGKTMEGIRALFFSKILGFINNSDNRLTEVYRLLKASKGKKLSVVSDQFEKFCFWNDTFSLTNRHIEKEQRRPVDKYFHIYPLFFIYEVLVGLKEKYGYEKCYLTKFELDTFLSLARTHDDLDEILERIVAFREHEEKYQIEKFLNEKNHIDSRIYPVLKLCKYFNWQTKAISIAENNYEEVKEKVKNFRELLKKNKLIFFNADKPKEYYDMLYSKYPLLEYHKRKLGN
jgi:superfamily II DNA or RNA helicase